MVDKSDFFNHLFRGKRFFRDFRHERDVFFYGKRRYQIIKLEDEADFFGAVIGKFVLR